MHCGWLAWFTVFFLLTAFHPEGVYSCSIIMQRVSLACGLDTASSERALKNFCSNCC